MIKSYSIYTVYRYLLLQLIKCLPAIEKKKKVIGNRRLFKAVRMCSLDASKLLQNCHDFGVGWQILACIGQSGLTKIIIR